MEQAENMLDEFQVERKRRSKFFIPIIILFSLFTIFMIIDLFFGFDRFSIEDFEWDWMSVVLGGIIPLTALFLFISKTKIGWCIILVYTSIIAIAGLTGTISNALETRDYLPIPRQLFILATTISVCSLLQTKSIRTYFRISTLVWLSTIAVAVLLVVLLLQS